MPTSLLVSDLDGTLLNSKKSVTPHTAQVLNRFVAAGGLFSIATARMAYGCDRLLAEVDLRLPAVVMNGAALYSFDTRTYTEVQPLPVAAATAVAEAVNQVGAGAFVYAVDSGQMLLGYSRESDLEWTQYNSVRAQEALPPLALLGSDKWDRLGETIYLAVVGTQSQLADVAAAVAGTPGLSAHPYRNIYTDTDCLEFSSTSAGKEAAVGRLQRLVGADRLVVFGDNHNDLAMMEMADHSLAPRESMPEALAIANEVIGSNDEDGVVGAIEQHWAEWLPGDTQGQPNQ